MLIQYSGLVSLPGDPHGPDPFVNLLFSDETILNVIRWDVSRPDYRPTRFDSSPPLERWKGLYDLRDRPGEYLNKITIRGVRRLLRYGPFRSSRLTVILSPVRVGLRQSAGSWRVFRSCRSAFIRASWANAFGSSTRQLLGASPFSVYLAVGAGRFGNQLASRRSRSRRAGRSIT